MSTNTDSAPQKSPPNAKARWDTEASLTGDDVGRLLYEWQLAGVRLYEVHIDRVGKGRSGEEALMKPVLDSRIRVLATSEGLLGRLTVVLVYPNEDSPEYRMRLSLEGLLTPKDLSIPRPEEGEVQGTRLAATILTLLWPYARETAHDLMRRMEVAIHPLPTIDRLQVQTMVERVAESGQPSEDTASD